MLQWLSLIAIILLGLAFTGAGDLHPDHYEALNDATLTKIDAKLKQFVRQNKRTPYNSMELRSYLKSEGHHLLSLYDSHGNAIHYQRFDKDSYVLRTLGSDEIEDNIKGRDDSITANLPIPESVRVTYADDTPFYPHLNLLGSRFGTLVAWLKIDAKLKHKQLVVRCTDNSQLIMTAPHRQVEEFLWLKGTEAIVYTASDGDETRLYLWHYGKGTVKSLSSKGFRSPSDTNGRYEKIYIALKGFDAKTRKLSYYRMASADDAIDPTIFFGKSHENILQFSPSFRRYTPILQLAAYAPRFSPKEPIPLNSAVTISERNTVAEANAWHELLVDGPASEILDSWQRFSISHTQSPLYPYSLWGLSTMYAQAHHIFSSADHSDAEQLQRYGMQISAALSNMPTAPRYLRAFARFNFGQLEQSLLPSLPLARPELPTTSPED